MYLSKIYIRNFRGIKKLKLDFDKKLNVIIGANGQMKSALIDAIRLFYSLGEPYREIEVTKEDFYVDLSDNKCPTIATHIDIVYIFEELTQKQQGVYYLFLEKKKDGTLLARVHLNYDITDNGRIRSSIFVGSEDNKQRIEWDSFQYFQHYYLGALRDSTKDLLSSRNNLLGKVIKRKIDKAKTENKIKKIIEDANKELLTRNEVTETQAGINNNLQQINKERLENVSLQIVPSRIEYIVNAIKPYLPYFDNNNNNDTEGFSLIQNSLGYNNLIYIATVLSDITERHKEDQISVYSLLIEEPEAHLHPQLQVNLYNFLKNADDNENSQTFITTHSPTLTSKIPLDNLILMSGNKALKVGDCFKERESENIIRDARTSTKLKNKDVVYLRNMVSRYFDVTRSQLLFSSGCLFIEGISECQLVETFSRIMGKSLTEHQIEIVDTDGTAFYQFMMLFNSSNESKRLPIKAAFVTDEDQFTDSKNKEYNLDHLVENEYAQLKVLREGINNDHKNGHVNNMESMTNNQPNVIVCSGQKTLEYQICKENVTDSIIDTKETWLYELLKADHPNNINKVEAYLEQIEGDVLSDEQQQNVALLLWKCLPSKAGFAQRLDAFLSEKIQSITEVGRIQPNTKVKFEVPKYIRKAINHLIA